MYRIYETTISYYELLIFSLEDLSINVKRFNVIDTMKNLTLLAR